MEPLLDLLYDHRCSACGRSSVRISFITSGDVRTPRPESGAGQLGVLNMVLMQML